MSQNHWNLCVRTTLLAGILLMLCVGSVAAYTNAELQDWKITKQQNFYCTDISPDSEYVAVGGQGKTVYLYSTNGTEIWNLSMDGPIKGVSLAKGATTIAIATNAPSAPSGSLALYNQDAQLLWKIPLPDVVNAVSITADADFLAAACNDGNVYLFDSTGSELWRYYTGGTIYDVSVADDGSLIAAGTSKFRFYGFDRTGTLLWEVVADGQVTGVGVSPAGSYVAAGTTSGRVYLDNYYGQESGFTTVPAQLTSLSLSNGGQYIVAGCRDNYARFFSTGLKGQFGKFTTTSAVNDVSISPDGLHVAVATNSGSLYYLTLPVTPALITAPTPIPTPTAEPIVPSPYAPTAVPTLAPETTGSLVVSSTPASASVYLDNIYLGITPLNKADVSAGSHQLLLQKDTYKDWSATIVVPAGQAYTVSANLETCGTSPFPSLPVPLSGVVVGSALVLGAIACVVMRKKEE